MFRQYGKWEDQSRREVGGTEIAKLGYWFGGQFTVAVDNTMALFYVRFADTSYAALPHKGRVNIPAHLDTREGQNVSVVVGYDASGEYSILDYWTDELNAQMQRDGNLLVGPHTQGWETINEVAGLTSEGIFRRISATQFEFIKTNLTASDPPTVNDDTTLGYARGSLWLTPAGLWILRNPADGAADWQPLGGVIAVADFDFSDPPEPAEIDAEFPDAVDGFAFQNDDDGTGDLYDLFVRQSPNWIRYEGYIVLTPPILTPMSGFYSEIPTFEWEDAD